MIANPSLYRPAQRGSAAVHRGEGGSVWPHVARIGRFEPTSQVWSACGVKDGPKPQKVRSWACTACGTVHDRDVKAAKNILALGRRERLTACGTWPWPGQGEQIGSAGTS
jgi:hypothetical protein